VISGPMSRGVRLATVGAAGWVALAAWHVAAAQVTQAPARVGRALTASGTAAVGPVCVAVPVFATTVVEQRRPRPRWAPVVGRAALAAGDSMLRRVGLIYFWRLGGLYGP